MLPELGRYETLRKIASGGMATVYLGRVVGEGGFERLVALKVMHPHIANDPDFVAMFLDEARLAARIRHPNVVATLDIQKTDEAMFIVMDYVDGPNLQEIRKHLRRRGERIPISYVVRIGLDVLNGLQEAHDLTDNDGNSLNLVHRDVSPHNVIIGRDGVAKLTDFGVARAEARISSTRGGQLKGKIAYMPPEQILTEPVSRSSDVYSAGVCMWEALVGKRLFRAPNDGAMVHMVLEGKTTPPSKHCHDIPPAIERVVMRAIARQPQNRYAEALDMADALEDAARESGVKIPKSRELGKLIKRLADEIGFEPDADRTITPPSYPGLQRQEKESSEPAGVSQPSMPSIGSGPSHPARPSDRSRTAPVVHQQAPYAPPPAGVSHRRRANSVRGQAAACCPRGTRRASTARLRRLLRRDGSTAGQRAATGASALGHRRRRYVAAGGAGANRPGDSGACPTAGASVAAAPGACPTAGAAAGASIAAACAASAAAGAAAGTSVAAACAAAACSAAAAARSIAAAQRAGGASAHGKATGCAIGRRCGPAAAGRG